uniref:Uncharacterized protein n=1 Tax=Sphaerodactylus townsendi TaxID=933632 RepID=A0ACB8E6E7_9SAUR
MDGQGGMAILLRHSSRWTVNRRIDVELGHLLIVDLNLKGDMPQENLAVRVCAVYGPQDRDHRQALWAMLKDFTAAPGPTYMVLGDFNNRARPEDRCVTVRRAPGEQGDERRVALRPVAPERLNGEERGLNTWLRDERGLLDAAQESMPTLDYYPTGGRKFHVDEFRQHLARYERVSGARINPDKTTLVDVRFAGEGVTVSALEEGLGPPARDPDRLVPSVKILGIWFGPAPSRWRDNWDKWLERVERRLQTWRGFHLLLPQKAEYLGAYLVGAGNYISQVYPPTATLNRTVMRQWMRFLVGTNHFPLKRAVIHADVADGGLGVPDPALLFTCRFIGANLIRREGDAIKWSFCHAMWGACAWMRAWAVREQGGVPQKIPAAMAGLPDHLCEFAGHVIAYWLTEWLVRRAREERTAAPGLALYLLAHQEHHLQPYYDCLALREGAAGHGIYIFLTLTLTLTL